MTEVFIVLTWLRGDLDEIVPFKSETNAKREAARILSTKLPDLHEELENKHDLDEWAEFRDNLLSLHQQEEHNTMLSCWEEWVEDHDGNAPFNVVVEQREVKP